MTIWQPMCPIVTEYLFPAVFKIFGSKEAILCKLSLRMRDITWPVPLLKIWVHILIYHPHISHPYDTLETLKLNVKGKIKRKSSKSKISQLLTCWGLGARGTKSIDFYCKRHSWIHVVWAILRQNWLEDWSGSGKTNTTIASTSKTSTCRDPGTAEIHFSLPGGVHRRPQRVTSDGSGGRRDMLRPPPLLLRPGTAADAAAAAAVTAV